MKLAIIDIDNIVANPAARFARAEEAKQAFLADVEARTNALLSGSSATKEATNLYWRTVFTPELVALDTLIEGVYEALNRLYGDGYDIYLLSSRPEAMREATLAWLDAAHIRRYWYDDRLVLKPAAAQYTKTVVWKASVIHMLAAMMDADEVLVVDDEQSNIDEIMRFADSAPYTIKCYRSLKLEEEEAGDDAGSPF